MVSVYLDASAVGKILLEETESALLAGYLDERHEAGTSLISSVLLETEIRRLASRHEISQSEATDLLARIDLLTPDRAVFTEAGLLPGANLRSLDALHIAVAIRAQAESMITYDRRQTTAAQAAGLPVIAPGTGTSTDPESASG